MHVAELLQTSALLLRLFDVTLEYLKAKARSAFGWLYLSLNPFDKLFTSTVRKYAWRRREVPGKSDSTPDTLHSSVFSGNGR